MKIAQIAPIIERVPPKKYGGTERVVYALTEELVKRGHDVTLFASGDSKTSAKLSSVYPKALREARLKDLYGVNLYTMLNIGLAYSRAHDFDIIHDHMGHISIPTANISPTPVVMTLHGAFTPDNKKVFSALQNPYFVSISKSQAAGFPSLSYAGNVYNGLAMKNYPFSKKNKGYLLFVGRITFEKGTHLAIETAEYLNLPLIIAAKLDTIDLQYFNEYVGPRLSEQIRWIGEVDENERNKLMSHALALLHPITWKEPFGLTMIEAMACGCPVIGMRLGSVPELVIHGKTGFVVEDIEEMIEAVTRVHKINRLDCRKHVLNTFSASKMAAGYEDVYEKILSEKYFAGKKIEKPFSTRPPFTAASNLKTAPCILILLCHTSTPSKKKALLPMIDYTRLYRLAYQALLNLAHEEGINASSKDEIFGCIFGRDSAITILKILKVHSLQPSEHLLPICKRALLVLVELQGKEVNLESGEEPGKFIHEFRRSKYEHLLAPDKPWFIYPDQTLKNYDSIDSTPLTLITLYKFCEITKDKEFLQAILPAAERGLRWIMEYGDLDKDFLIEYQLPPGRKHGGLVVQSWTDSYQSLADQLNNLPKGPIAPVEVQSFAWLALKLWVDPFKESSPLFSQKINSFAEKMKKEFNKRFILKDHSLFFGAQALDGDNKQIKTITANPLLCLWAACKKNGQTESILNFKYIDNFIKRAFLPDMFVEDAGIRTMSSLSPTFNPNEDSYHNGSFWPMLNGLIVEGFENFHYLEEATKLRRASLLPIHYFDSPIELYIKKDQNYCIYTSPSGQTACRLQAWSAAAILDLSTPRPL